MNKAFVHEKSFEIESDENGYVVNGKRINWDLAKISDRYFNVIFEGKSYNAEVVAVERETKSFQIKINGKIYPVVLKDRFDLLLEKMGMNNTSAGKVNNVKAPMPGLIVDLRVKEGDEVKAGDTLLILEAMKMENIIKSAGAGVVKAVKAKKGDSVEKNQILIEF